MQENISTYLKNKKLSITLARENILQLFVNQRTALAHNDIEQSLKNKIDRVTIYRTLNTFVQKGLLHTIPSADNMIKYALCKENCSEEAHTHNHLHFTCIACEQTECLPQQATPQVKTPKGYKTLQTEIVLTGYCKKCNEL